MFSPSSPITGAAISGLTTPTYTLTVDTPPDVNSKQWAVTALGGTQTGVSTHTPESPFTLTFKRPKSLKGQPVKNPVSGVISGNPKNEYKMLVRKGMSIDAVSGQKDVLLAELRLVVPSGTALASPAEINAAASFIGGVVASQIQGICDTAKTGIA